MSMPEKINILLADDERHIRVLIKRMIKKLDTEFIWEAKNGGEAVEFYKEFQPDLTLLDINMPIKTGIEALEEIREFDPKALVIILTSLANMEDIQRCAALGAAGYIRKDLDEEEMIEIIENSWNKWWGN